VGLITGLLTLPLAPVRGTVWIAARVAEQAARELDEETGIRRELAELEMRYDLGEISEAEYAEAEESLFERLVESQAPRDDEVGRPGPDRDVEEV
jgi:hypothetical protein